MTMAKGSELGLAHRHSNIAKWTEPHGSSPHDGTCKAPSEGD